MVHVHVHSIITNFMKATAMVRLTAGRSSATKLFRIVESSFSKEEGLATRSMA